MIKRFILILTLAAAIATAPRQSSGQIPIIILTGTNFVDYRILNTNFALLADAITNIPGATDTWSVVSGQVTEAAMSWPAVSQAVTEASSSWPAVSGAVTAAAGSWPAVSAAVTEASSSWPAVSAAVTEASSSWPAVSGAVTAAANSWPAVSGAVSAAAASWPTVSGAVTEAAASWPAVSGAVVLASTPIGGIIQYGNSNAPSGWLMCDGGGSHTNTFAALHAVIGYQFGGSGTNFLRPDLRRRVSAGMGSGYNLGAIGGYENVTLTTNQMPAHTHITTLDSFLCLRGNVAGTHWFAAGGKAYERLEEKTTSSAGGGLSHSNMPPYIVLNSIIFAGK